MKVTTAADLERMTLCQREAHLRACVVRDLDQVPPEFLARIRGRLQRRIAHDSAG